MTFLLILVAAASVIVIVSSPFRREPTPAGPAPDDRRTGQRRADLEVAREVKYREIRDAELDHRSGKLSDEDFRLLDGSLRAEAITILQELDRVQADGGDTIGA